MDRSEALTLVEPHLTKARFEHTKRVAETATKLAKMYGHDTIQADLAAIFHDYAKNRNKDELRQWIVKESLPQHLLSYHHELWHGPVGAILVKKELGIDNEAVLSAIRWHTTGKAGMSLLDKIVFLADYIEPGRQFPGVEEVRTVADNDLNLGCWLASRNTISFLMSKNQPIYPDTFHAYNDLLLQINKD
ncbi:HD domain-containing protein [Aquibacillus halophilus]|uniref:bis(5'-nucleosyl)-tetraphosphatase (symmetrical) n=1 Tax=Aquibacillus halophilus TaxID=930132 RepID=A0A6A8DEV7_9BACI|nr:bis(5'-nucleosyl)-tetraphosphatase (symmetrical) YqeK [Aquibacillus halophilus]MRH43056.1 HD domain-containing protein [Aquibacillus halophilus]